MRNDKLFDKVLDKIYPGLSITFTKNNIAEGDTFLNLKTYSSQTITFDFGNSGILVEFEYDEPLHLDELPSSFLESILLNLE